VGEKRREDRGAGLLVRMKRGRSTGFESKLFHFP
jgi:hypothetical protein